MTEVSIRRAVTGDVSATELAAFAARTFPDACPPSLPAGEIEAFIGANLSPAEFERHLAAAESAVFVAEAAGAVVGYALSIHGVHDAGPTEWAGRRTAYLSKLYVDRELRGAGVAGRLLAAAVDAARAEGCAALWLGVNSENARARAFYARSGMRVAGQRRFAVGSLECVDDVLAIPL